MADYRVEIEFALPGSAATPGRVMDVSVFRGIRKRLVTALEATGLSNAVVLDDTFRPQQGFGTFAFEFDGAWNPVTVRTVVRSAIHRANVRASINAYDADEPSTEPFYATAWTDKVRTAQKPAPVRRARTEEAKP